jgi:hypothetical protein
MITGNGVWNLHEKRPRLETKSASCSEKMCHLSSDQLLHGRNFDLWATAMYHGIMDGEALTMRRGEQPISRKWLAELLNSDAKEDIMERFLQQAWRLTDPRPSEMGVPWDLLYPR